MILHSAYALQISCKRYIANIPPPPPPSPLPPTTHHYYKNYCVRLFSKQRTKREYSHAPTSCTRNDHLALVNNIVRILTLRIFQKSCVYWNHFLCTNHHKWCIRKLYSTDQKVKKVRHWPCLTLSKCLTAVLLRDVRLALIIFVCFKPKNILLKTLFLTEKTWISCVNPTTIA